MTAELINIEGYWKNSQVRPRGFTELCDMVETHGKVTGIWMWEQWDPKTGEVRKREITKNVVTDDGAIEIFKCAIANAVPAAVFNNIYINNNSGSSQLSSALTNGQIITTGANLAVLALPAQVPLNYPSPANAAVTTLTLGYGTGQTQTVTMNATTAQGATNLNVVGFTTNAAYAANSNIVPLPNIAENPSNANLKANQSGVVEMYSGVIASGNFTYTATTGAGNRSVVITFVFKNSVNGGSTPNGSYTDAWLVNVTTAAAANNYVAHEINTPMQVNNSNNVTVTMTLKI